jgi:hypothetical protein
MHIVRVNHKNGLLLEFLYKDPGRADDCAKVCAEAKMRGNAIPPQASPCHVFDDAGRETWLDGQAIQAVQVADLQQEVVHNTMVRVLAEQDAMSVLKRAGMASTNGDAREPVDAAPEQLTAQQPRPQPAIGRFSG